MQLRGKWDKLGQAEPVDVMVHGFSQAQGNSGDIRPVAIVEEISTGSMRYVDLSYITLDPKRHVK